jgi:hypothetical protein
MGKTQSLIEIKDITLPACYKSNVSVRMRDGGFSPLS